MNTQLENLVSTLETCGSNPENWPAESRAALQAFIATSAEARAAVSEATQLDRWLNHLPEPGPAPALADRILAELPVRPTRSNPRQPAPRKPRALWVLPLAAAALLALWVAPPTPPEAPQTAHMQRVATIGSETESFVWEMPSDVLLNVASLDPINDVPEFDCHYNDQDCFGLMENRESSVQTASRNLT